MGFIFCPIRTGYETIVVVSTVIFGRSSCGLTKSLQLIKDGRKIASWTKNGALKILASKPEDRDYAVVFASLFFSGFMDQWIPDILRDWYSGTGLKVYS
jgi:hypothetical protein